jgi:hypothetical protein
MNNTGLHPGFNFTLIRLPPHFPSYLDMNTLTQCLNRNALDGHSFHKSVVLHYFLTEKHQNGKEYQNYKYKQYRKDPSPPTVNHMQKSTTIAN